MHGRVMLLGHLSLGLFFLPFPANLSCSFAVHAPNQARRIMAQRLFPGGLVILLGIMLLFIPFHLFPVCADSIALPSGKSIPMRCFYTGKVEIGLGIALLLLGVSLSLFTSRLIRFGLCLAGMCFALLILAVPTLLVGVCLNPTMACQIGTFPALMVLGGFATLFFFIMTIVYGRGLRTREH